MQDRSLARNECMKGEECEVVVWEMRTRGKKKLIAG